MKRSLKKNAGLGGGYRRISSWLDVGVARERDSLESIGDEYFSFRGDDFSGKHVDQVVNC